MLARMYRNEGHGAGSGILEAWGWLVVAQGHSKIHSFDPTWILSAGLVVVAL